MANITGFQRDYWINRLRKLLDDKKNALLASVPGFMAAAAATAFAQKAAQIGIVDEWAAYNDLDKRADQLEMELYSTRRQRDALGKSICDKVQSSTGTCVYASTLEQTLVKMQIGTVLATTPVGRELLEIDAAKESVEDSIMMATTPTKLLEAIAAAAEKLGIEIS